MARTPKRSPFVIAAVTIAALALYVAAAFLVDARAFEFLDSHPVTANTVVALLLFPFEILVVSWIVRWWLDRQRDRQWKAVADELAEAIGTRWSNLRTLVTGRYGLDEVAERRAAIAEADRMWADLERQQEAQPFHVRGTPEAHWVIPSGMDETIATVFGIWNMMWGAGVDDEERALRTRLTNVLLPRLNPSEPDLAGHVRRLVDAIEDLTDARQVLENWMDPFPGSLPDVIPEAAPVVARDALAQLNLVLDAAQAVVTRGDALTNGLAGAPTADAPAK